MALLLVLNKKIDTGILWETTEKLYYLRIIINLLSMRYNCRWKNKSVKTTTPIY